MVQMHLAAVPQQGEGEQGRHRRQPEQQIQHEGQRGQPDAPAQGAHPIVEQAQQRSKGQSLPEYRRLDPDVHIHLSVAAGPGTRPGSPPRRPRS